MANRDLDMVDGDRKEPSRPEKHPGQAQPVKTGEADSLGDRSTNAQGGVDPDGQNLRTSSRDRDRQWLDEEDDEL